MIEVEIWSDFICPFCYIGKREFERALEATGLKDQTNITYNAFELHADGPLEPNQTVLESMSEKYGQPVSAMKQNMTALTERAAGLGLEYHFDRLLSQDTLKAHRVAKYADTQGKGAEFQEAALHGVFTDNVFLPDTDTLVKLGEEVGLNGDEVRKIADDSQAYLETVQQEKRKGGLLGITGVPFFQVNGKYAVQGAQLQQTFEEVLLKAAEQKGIKPALQVFGDTEDVCGPEGCEI